MFKYNLRRYHYKLWFPDYYQDLIRNFFEDINIIQPTIHGLSELNRDKRGKIPIPTLSDLLNNHNILIEIYERLDNNNNPLMIAQKLVIRVAHLSDKYDYTYVIARKGFIVSAWAVDKDDNHRLTYSANSYYIPENLKENLLYKLSKEQKKYEETQRKYLNYTTVHQTL